MIPGAHAIILQPPAMIAGPHSTIAGTHAIIPGPHFARNDFIFGKKKAFFAKLPETHSK